jgi:hypothetical protein
VAAIIAEKESFYSAVRTGPLNKAVFPPSLKAYNLYFGTLTNHVCSRDMYKVDALFEIRPEPRYRS